MISDAVVLGNVAYNGASVSAWKASSFVGVPAENSAPPGAADAGPVTSGPLWGAEGAFQITVPTSEDYYVGVTIGGVVGWKFYSANAVTDSAVNVKDYGALGNGVADDYAAITAAVAGCPAGGTLWFPAGTYLLSAMVVVNRQIHLRGSWSNTKGGDVTSGSILQALDLTHQAAMTALIQVSVAFQTIKGLAGIGLGTTSSALVNYTTGSHMNVMSDCYGELFLYGAYLDGTANHITFRDTEFSNNNDGVGCLSSYNDFSFDHCGLDGNTRSSFYLGLDIGVLNLLFLRTHLGFSQYGLYQEPTTSLAVGFDGLTMIASPIEFVSVQHISAKTGGAWYIDGSCYWGWNGTPANPCVVVGPVTTGPILIRARLLANTPNANSPYVIGVTSYTNYSVVVDSPLNGFAQTVYGSHATTTPRMVKVTATGSYTVPSGCQWVRIIAVGGGGGGSGGGSALTSGGVSNQHGAGGSAAGQVVDQLVQVSPGESLSVVIGTGGTGGAGGALNSNAGIFGGAGVSTTVTGTGVSITALGGTAGVQSGANSGTTVNSAVWGGLGSTSTVPGTGSGGTSQNPGGFSPSNGGGGGGGGGTASATLGGGGGAGGTSGAGGAGGGAAASGTAAGVTGGSGAANTGAGAGGGGGGAPGGKGGDGGTGGSGVVLILAVA